MLGSPRQISAVVLGLILSVSLVACSGKDKDAAQQAQHKVEPIVSTIIVQPQTIKIHESLNGRLEASRKAEVRARIPGVLQKRLFKEGSLVKKGQELYIVDDGPYRAALNKARANFTNAQLTLNRMKPLAQKGAVSQQALDQAKMAYQLALADLDTARINYGYAHIKAPISGRISRSLVTEGALVGQNGATLLTTISQDNPLYVHITQSSQDYFRMKQEAREGKIELLNEATPMDVTLSDGSKYQHKGKLLFTDPTVDESTGQVTLKAEIPNPPDIGGQPLLMPGMFVSVSFSQAEIKDAYLIPKEAVTRGATVDTVMLVSKDGTFKPQPIKILQEQGIYWVVTGGLNPGDRVMVTGFSKLMPGVKTVNYDDISINDIEKVKMMSLQTMAKKMTQAQGQAQGKALSEEGKASGNQAQGKALSEEGKASGNQAQGQAPSSASASDSASASKSSDTQKAAEGSDKAQKDSKSPEATTK